MSGYVIFLLCLAVAALAFYAGFKYGLKLESDAFREYAKLRAALVKTGVKVETYLTGEAAKVHAELGKVLKLPQDMGDFIKNEIKAKIAKF